MNRKTEHDSATEHLYSTGEVSEILGVPPSTLKAWESRGFLPIKQSSGKHRRYTEAEIKQIVQVKVLTERYRFRQQVLDALARGEAVDVALPVDVSGRTFTPLDAPFSREWFFDLAARNAELFSQQRNLARQLSAAEERYRLLVESCPDVIATTDLGGLITYVSSAVRRYGHEPADLVGKSIAFFRQQARKDSLVEAWPTASSQVVPGEAEMPAADGRTAHFELTSVPLREGGEVTGSLIVAHDITERRKAEDALRRSEEKFRVIATSSPDSVFAQDLDLRYRWFLNPVPPVTEADVIGKTDLDLFLAGSFGTDLEDTHRRTALKRHVMQTGELAKYETQFLVSGRWRYFEIICRPWHDAQGRIIGVLGYRRDITERKEAEDALSYLSFHDRLTGLYNRAFFEEEVSRLERSREYPITVVSCDTDGLKPVNDTHGHHKGDDLLKALAGVLSDAFRRSDIVARIGGDEFSVILPRTSAKAAEALCARLKNGIQAYSASHPDLPLSVSIGIATAPDSTVAMAEVLRRADADMYRDKLHHGPSGTHRIVRALLDALATKDCVSEGHVARMKGMVQGLGRVCGISTREMSEVMLLAEVHDLGKVGVPDQVLLKPGPLSPDEREQMRQHCALGCRIARASPELSHIANLILHHHEWWDGRGYPSGLRGQATPFLCRMLAIADAYDSMTNDRPYRNAMPVGAALEEIKRCAGTQFDPTLAEALLATLRGAKAIGR